VTLNGTMLHAAQESMSFGGVGASGMGGYHGHDGFRRFSHARSVHKIGFINVFESSARLGELLPTALPASFPDGGEHGGRIGCRPGRV
jgi:hypothetical protein